MRILILILIINLCYQKSSNAQWSDVNLGVNGPVNAFYVDSVSDLLFVGGQFDTAGGLNINNIATWDGANWNSFGNNQKFTSPGLVSAIVSFNGSIIVGGKFDSIGTTLVNNIARWNGVSWESLGNGFDNNVADLIVYQSELYATGSFAYSGSDLVACLAKWNGTSWERISQLIGDGYSLAILNDILVVGGSFYHPHIRSIYNIIGWNGNAVDTSLGGFNDAVFNVRNISDTLYVVGSFTSISINPSNYISVYYDQSWHSIGSPVGGQNWILDVTNYNNDIYLCGYFTNPPDLCKYNGTSFDSVANVYGYLKVLKVYKNNLYIGGGFTKLNGVSINNIAQYNDLGNFVFKNNIGNGSVNVFPNPNHDGKFNLDLDIEKYVGKIKITIYSFDGNTIYSYESKATSLNNFEINILPVSGAYYLKCEINNSMILVKKIIVL